jgi:hypothetical protein
MKENQWATPNTMDYMATRTIEGTLKHATEARKGRSGPCNLREQVDQTTMEIYKMINDQQWSTPDLSDRRSAKSKQQGLSNQVKRIWMTPKSEMTGMSAKTSGRPVEKSTQLTTQVAVAEGLIDMTTGNLLQPATKLVEMEKEHADLFGYVNPFEHMNLFDWANSDTILETPPVSCPLNPDWVCALMDVSIGWVSPEGRLRDCPEEKVKAIDLLWKLWKLIDTHGCDWSYSKIQNIMKETINRSGIRLSGFTQNICWLIKENPSGCDSRSEWLLTADSLNPTSQTPAEQFKIELACALRQLTFETEDSPHHDHIVANCENTLSKSAAEAVKVEAKCQGNRADELRMLGNGVVPATAAKAFAHLFKELRGRQSKKQS